MKLDRSVFNERLRNIDVSLFVDEKKKVALVFCKDREDWTNFTAYMIGKDGYYKEVYLGESTTSWPFVYSYIPSRPGLYKDGFLFSFLHLFFNSYINSLDFLV